MSETRKNTAHAREAPPSRVKRVSEGDETKQSSAETALTPIQMLAVALAYMTEADKVRDPVERAELVVVFGKMVSRGEMSEDGLGELIQFAFERAEATPIDDFLAEAAHELAPLQKVAIYINALDLMLADGRVVESEQGLLKKLQDAFGIEHDTTRAIREVLFLKNDTRMFLHPEHPRNALGAELHVTYGLPSPSNRNSA